MLVMTEIKNPLVIKAKKGDLEAFGELVRLSQDALRCFIAMLGIPRDKIEDIAQESYLKAFKALHTFDDEKEFAPWLRGIARNQVWEYYASEQAKKNLFAELLLRHSMEENQEIPHFRMSHLLACLKKLPAKAMTLVNLKYYHAKKSDEIAGICEQKPAAVRIALMRIRLQLKDCIEKNLREELQ